jgi:hypothetical protein
MNARETIERYGLTPGEWDTSLLRCVACGSYFDPDELAFMRTWRGPVCAHCDDSGEADFTSTHRNDEREVEPRSSHPHEEGTLSEHRSA